MMDVMTTFMFVSRSLCCLHVKWIDRLLFDCCRDWRPKHRLRKK